MIHAARRPIAKVALVALWLGAIVAVPRTGPAADSPEGKRVLLVTGEDYPGHKWKLTAPVLKDAIAADSRLSVDVLDDLTKLGGTDLGQYDAVVMHFKNYDPNVPGRPAFDKLVTYVEEGGGLVLVHFACGAFQEFRDEFVKLAGRAWNPKLRGHDPRGPFRVEITQADHPITRGMEPFETDDELYTCLEGDPAITVLAEAKSKVDGKQYPMAFVLEVGKGRVFHCPLGHDVKSLEVPAVGELFRRGTAWAAGLAPVPDETAAAKPQPADPWVFVSIPDFLNVDTEYPQEGWEDAVGYALDAVKAENPDFVLVAGDLVMGRWWSEADIDKYADIYYPAWIERMKAHGLEFYTAIGDHELGDNPWPPEKARLVPRFKAKFREHLGMPANGPASAKGTAFWWMHKGVLFVAVDVFQEGRGSQGEIVCRVSGEQLDWLDKTLDEHRDADHVVVMGHTPILTPVWKWSSSGLTLDGGRESPLWQTLSRHGADLYLCGEVHAITCTERDGVQQIAHGGLFGYNPEVSYLVGTVSPDRMELELKTINIDCSGERLWQVGNNRPHQQVTIAPDVKQEGYQTVGTMVIDKTGTAKTFRDKTGLFDESHNPVTDGRVVEIGRLRPPVRSQRELTVKQPVK